MATEEKNNSYRELLQGIFSGHPEALGDLVVGFLNQLLKAEQAEYLRAAPYERTAEREDYRSGFRSRTIKTRLGKLTLMLPKPEVGL